MGSRAAGSIGEGATSGFFVFLGCLALALACSEVAAGSIGEGGMGSRTAGSIGEGDILSRPAGTRSESGAAITKLAVKPVTSKKKISFIFMLTENQRFSHNQFCFFLMQEQRFWGAGVRIRKNSSLIHTSNCSHELRPKIARILLANAHSSERLALIFHPVDAQAFVRVSQLLY